MSLLSRCSRYLQILFIAALVLLGAIAVPAMAQANDGDLQPPVETSETAVPVPEPVETELPENPSEVPDNSSTKPPAVHQPSETPVTRPPVKPAPVVPAPAPVAPAPAPMQPAPISSPTEEAVVLETEDVEDAKVAMTEPSNSASPSASPAPSATASSSAAPTAVPSELEAEESEAVMSSSPFPGGQTAAQGLMIALLLAVGVLYLRFMRRGVKHVATSKVLSDSETGK